MNNLRAKILIKIDILTLKNIDLIIFIYIDYINSYYTIFQLIIISLLRSFIKYNIIIEKLILISTYFYIIILIK